MCFNLEQQARAAYKRAIFNGDKDAAAYWRRVADQSREWFHAPGFAHPKIIVYQNSNPNKPESSIWGLVPHWAKTPESIWGNTLNARGETLFEKSTFKKAAEETRCLIPVNGFYDYHDYRGKKYPFFITLKEQDEPMYFAGIWNNWINRETGEILNTFSIVTTRANPLMSKIHNKPKHSNDPRMPVILPDDIREDWLKPLSQKEIQELATYQFTESKLDAWTVRKLSGKDSPGNSPEADKKFTYADLDPNGDTQKTLF